MGLDAVVYCNCYETGRLKSPPPSGIEIVIAPDGSIQCEHETVEAAIELDAWTLNNACEHKDCTLLHHYLGNVSLVAFLRTTFQQHPSRLPILLSKVVYNGIHAGDYLTLDDVRIVQEELAFVAKIRCDREEDQRFLNHFCVQMAELVDAALALRKPIAF